MRRSTVEFWFPKDSSWEQGTSDDRCFLRTDADPDAVTLSVNHEAIYLGLAVRATSLGFALRNFLNGEGAR